jgi:hypothetical protein
MFEVVRPVVRAVRFGMALAASAALCLAAGAQSNKPPVHHRETNASREARIQRTIADTYSHRWEIFGGGGYLRFRSGETTQRNNEVSWATSAHYFLNPKLAIAGDARGSFGSAHATQPNIYGVNSPQINEYFFMGGVDYRFYAKQNIALSGEALGGVGWGIFSGGSKDIVSTRLGLWQDATKPAFSLGVNADYNFYPNLAFRLTPTYVATYFTSPATGGSMQGNFGFNAGVVYRFGRQ